MKKLIALLLIVSIGLSVCACGKSEAVKAYEVLVNEIGDVSLESKDAIVAAEDAYDNLLDEEKEAAKKYHDLLVTKREKLNTLIAEAEQQERLDSVIALIEAIGEVSLASGKSIIAAEEGYNDLPDDEKKMISEDVKKLSEARTEYDGLVAEQMAARAKEVASAIDAIGTVTLKSEAAINEAKKKYNALTADEKKLVTNRNVLETAEASYNKLWKAEKDRIIKEYSKQFEISSDPVEGIKWYMHKNMPEYIDSRSYIIPYIGVKNNQVWICIRYNYTDDDWVFWEKLTIVADEKKYNKSVSYYNITRDNEYGSVWECYDEVLGVGEAMGAKDIKMLQAIADSKETIIRFEGDDYHYDLYVSSKDKKMIRDVLTIYKAMLS